MAYWSDLPPELLDLVATRFYAPSDTRHFRSVCTMWRLAVPRQLFVQFLPIKFFNSTDLHHCDIRLAKHTFFHISSSSNPDLPGWLIKTEEHKPESFQLFNPFSRTSIKILPSHNFPKQLDLTKIRIRELGHEYVLRNVSRDDMELYDMEHEKVAIISTCSRPYHSNENYVILSTHNTGKLLMYRSDQQTWSFLDDLSLGYDDRSIFVNDWSLHYVDVGELNGTFYAVTNSGRTVSIKVMSDSTVNVALLKKSIIGGHKKCLVKSTDELLMVDLYTDITPAGLVTVLAAEIFKLDEEGQKWDLVESLGDDQALFLSNHSSLSAIGVPGCKGNCIYFQFKNFDKNNKCCSDDLINEGKCDEYDTFEWKSEQIGVFDFGKGVVGCLEEYLEDSQLFSWPPPAWMG